MKKTFDSFAQCLELREVIFLKTLPSHPHLVPAYDIFLDPFSKKLHIAMENMDGNLYQLMKTRDHKPFDGATVKSILFQILSGLEHIHDNGFFHRDIKPENILVSSSAPDAASAFKRYSALVTPPSTPPTYTIKLADFGLARETHSLVPYTTYVSTRWYRAPEVLLRAGKYSAPVDIWAFGAMAVEVATLKPLFPGGNEVDQVWRVCEIMGSPGTWVNKHGQKLGGGEWAEGTHLAAKLGFAFPKMAPHSMDSIIQAPQWPASLANFVTWCLLWDPAARPTSTQAMQHEYFADAVDPLRPNPVRSNSRPNSSRFLHRKSSGLSSTAVQFDSPESNPSLSTKKSSWFRKSLTTQDLVAPAPPAHASPKIPAATRPVLPHANTAEPTTATKSRPAPVKRTSWNSGQAQGVAPIPILPSIKPVSPIHHAVNASGCNQGGEKPKRQASLNNGGHYPDYHREQAERALTGNTSESGYAASGTPKESFFSHLRKRARRFSGRYNGAAPASPSVDDVEANAGCGPWAANRQSMSIDNKSSSQQDSALADLDRALESVRNSLDTTGSSHPQRQVQRVASNPLLKRHHSVHAASVSPSPTPTGATNVRQRVSVRYSMNARPRYDTPDEEDELLDEALSKTRQAVSKLNKQNFKGNNQASRPTHIDLGLNKENGRPPMSHVTSDPGPAKYQTAYLTPSPSKELSGMNFGPGYTSKPIHITPPRQAVNQILLSEWPTPPYEENEWAKRAARDLAAQADAAFR